MWRKQNQDWDVNMLKKAMSLLLKIPLNLSHRLHLHSVDSELIKIFICWSKHMNHLTLECSLFGVAMPTLKEEAAGEDMGLLVSPAPLWGLWGAPIAIHPWQGPTTFFASAPFIRVGYLDQDHHSIWCYQEGWGLQGPLPQVLTSYWNLTELL